MSDFTCSSTFGYRASKSWMPATSRAATLTLIGVSVAWFANSQPSINSPLPPGHQDGRRRLAGRLVLPPAAC